MLGVRASVYKLGEGDAIQFIAEGKKPHLAAPLFRPLQRHNVRVLGSYVNLSAHSTVTSTGKNSNI